MTIPDINGLRNDILMELATSKASNGNPANVIDICKKIQPLTDWKEEAELARSAAWLLVRASPPLAKRVSDSDRPGAMLIALTAAGKSEASTLAGQPRTHIQKLLAVIKKDWIAILALVVSIFALFRDSN